jgi:hypothetical protein
MRERNGTQLPSGRGIGHGYARMDADEAKAEWFSAFRNILLFIRANPRKSVAKNALKGSLQ